MRRHGVEVRTLQRPPGLRDLVEAALDVRRQYPRLTLAVSGPAKLVRELERRYPALVDVPLTTVTVEAVLAALSL